MDADTRRTSQGVPFSTANGHVNGGLVVDHSIHTAACALCRRILPPDNDDLETISICGDCKFLLLEDFETPSQDFHPRRLHRGRRTRYSSSESIENLFSQQLSQMINLVRQNHSTVSGNEDQSVDSDASSWLFQHTSSRTTPNGSRRWQRVFSDTESEGFDNVDSLYGESETNLRSSRYRVFHSESDAISFSAYGGDSDASVDGHSFLDRETLIQADEESNLDSDTDIDPMHAGLNQWHSDEEEEEEDGDWEEADMEEDTVESVEAGARLRNFFISSPSEGNGPVSWHRQFRSPEFEGLIHWRVRQGRQTYNRDMFDNLEESESPQDGGISGNYTRRFEELLEALTESDSTRRGAPPAAMSILNNLPRVIINEEHEKHDGLVCAICKDVLPIGTEVSQLPCLHLYHPSCILPWLSARNSCPLCRYELPTDDRDYEEGKQNATGRMEMQEIQQQDVSEDSSSNVSDGAEADELREFGQGGMAQRELLDMGTSTSSCGREGSRRRWFFLAAAPIVSLFGIVLVLWLGNPQGRGPTSQCNFPERGLHQIQFSGSSPSNQRGNRRRWWSLF